MKRPKSRPTPVQEDPVIKKQREDDERKKALIAAGLEETRLTNGVEEGPSTRKQLLGY